MGQAAWIGNAVTRRSILERLLGALLLVVDNLRLHLLCLCSFVCGCGPPCAPLAWWTHIGWPWLVGTYMRGPLDGRVGNNFSTEGDNFCWSSRPKLYKFPMKWQQKRVLSIGWNAQIYSSEHSGGVRNIELSTHRSYHMKIMWHFTLNPFEIVEALRLKIMRPFASQDWIFFWQEALSFCGQWRYKVLLNQRSLWKPGCWRAGSNICGNWDTCENALLDCEGQLIQ